MCGVDEDCPPPARSLTDYLQATSSTGLLRAYVERRLLLLQRLCCLPQEAEWSLCACTPPKYQSILAQSPRRECRPANPPAAMRRCMASKTDPCEGLEIFTRCIGRKQPAPQTGAVQLIWMAFEINESVG